MIQKCGFEDVNVFSQQGMGRDWLSLYPIFSEEFLELMFRLLPEDRHDDTVIAVFIEAHKR